MIELPKAGPLGYRRRAICQILEISERTFDRMRVEDKFPPPDVAVGSGAGVIYWSEATLRRWLDRQKKNLLGPIIKMPSFSITKTAAHRVAGQSAT
jgi:predicted DNA-binding transcriptional regulator AlpA